MGETVGCIYILTNPAMPEWIKIGYADDVEERVRVLNSSDGMPLSFQVYATYDVPIRLADKKLHAIIDQLNPDLRSIEVKDGKARRREFYAMPPEAAFGILQAMAELHGFENRLHLWTATDEDKTNDKIADATLGAKKKLEAFRFSMAGVPVGASIQFKNDPAKTAEVVNDRTVRYDGRDWSLSALALHLTGREGTLQGPLYFTYEGETLADRRKRLADE